MSLGDRLENSADLLERILVSERLMQACRCRDAGM